MRLSFALPTTLTIVLALAGMKVLLYDGSFEDWSKHPDYLLENPADAAKTPVKAPR